jgi:thiol:disulfide interchange protein DsbD
MDTQSINELLTQAFASNQAHWYIFSLAFLGGILVSFTPCVYPMIPITVGILQGQTQKSLFHNILLSICYVLGIALVYATLGYISATSALIFGQWFSHPVFIVFVVFFFLYLAGSMFGFYELYIPSFASRTTGVNTSGALFNAFVYGLISGTVASPCLTPALAILLGVVAKQADPILGFFTLFSFALGMCVLLIIVGAFSSTLTLLPRAGNWMLHVKTIFGYLLLLVCVYFLKPFLDPALILGAYIAISVLAAIHLVKTMLFD